MDPTTKQRTDFHGSPKAGVLGEHSFCHALTYHPTEVPKALCGLIRIGRQGISDFRLPFLLGLYWLNLLSLALANKGVSRSRSRAIPFQVHDFKTAMFLLCNALPKPLIPMWILHLSLSPFTPIKPLSNGAFSSDEITIFFLFPLQLSIIRFGIYTQAHFVNN